jgi:hypothetical protein
MVSGEPVTQRIGREGRREDDRQGIWLRFLFCFVVKVQLEAGPHAMLLLTAERVKTKVGDGPGSMMGPVLSPELYSASFWAWCSKCWRFDWQ